MNSSQYYFVNHLPGFAKAKLKFENKSPEYLNRNFSYFLIPPNKSSENKHICVSYLFCVISQRYLHYQISSSTTMNTSGMGILQYPSDTK